MTEGELARAAACRTPATLRLVTPTRAPGLLVTPNGLVVRWSQHDLSGYQFDRPDYRQIQHIMGKALAEVLRALGFRLTPTKFPGSYLVSRGTRE